MNSLLIEDSDLKWLREVHLKDIKDLPVFRLAKLVGNEDCPTEIILYQYNHYPSKRRVYKLNYDGNGYYLATGFSTY